MQRIYLGAGHTYDVTHSFTVLAGTTSYSIQVSAVDANDQPVQEEEISTVDHVTTATLVGLPNVTVAGVSVSNPTPTDGQTVQVMVDVRNVSNQAVGGFQVSLYRGDPRLASDADPVTLLATQNVAALGPFGDSLLTFPWTVPLGGGNFILTAVADSTDVLTESTRSDNYGHVTFSVEPDAAIFNPRSSTQVSATVLNYSGVNNVVVAATVSNLGQARLHNVTVELLSSLDDGAFQSVGTVNIPLLAAGAHHVVTFTASGLAGSNRYRVVVDPDNVQPDSNRSNNGAETLLVLQGFPDLLVPEMQFLETQTPTQGQALTVQAVIQNQGIAAAHAISVEVFAGNPYGDGAPIGQMTLDALAALSSTTVDIPVDTTKLIGNQAIWVIVNRQASFLETTFANNTAILRTIFYPVDTVPPTSIVDPLPAVTSTPDFLVQWQGQDGPQPGASDIAFFDIYASVDGGPFFRWLHTAATSAIYSGLEGHTYAFFSQATDNAGNIETRSLVSQTQTVIPTPSAQIHGIVFNDANSNRRLNTGESGLAGWTVFLDLNHDGALDPGDPVTTTDANGATSSPACRRGPIPLWKNRTPTLSRPPPAPRHLRAPASHFVQRTGAGLHYAWASQGPASPNVITIWYDFRSLDGFVNQITPAEMLIAEQSLQAWSDASLGRLRFVQNTTAPIADIINIGVGDMAAVDGVSGPTEVLSRGGALASTTGSPTLSNGVVWLDVSRPWDTTGAPTEPLGTFAFFPVVSHEIGLALGLAESSDRASDDIMAGVYPGPVFTLSLADQLDIQAVYPVVPPTPDQATSLTVPLQPGQIATGANFGNFQPFGGVKTFAQRAGGAGSDRGLAVAADAAGNVYVAGEFQGPATFTSQTQVITLPGFGGEDAFVAKYAPDGQLLWVQPLGGPENDVANAIAVDAAGNVTITGSFNGLAQFGTCVLNSPASEGGNAFVARLDTNGNVLWVKEIDAGIGASGQGIALDAADNVYVTGSFVGQANFLGQIVQSATGNQGNSFVLKLDAAGDFLWVSQFGKPDGIQAGDASSPNALAVDPAGTAIYIAGSFRGTDVDFGTDPLSPHRLDAQGGSDLFVEKLDGQGNYVWAVRAGSYTPEGMEGLGESCQRHRHG